MNSKVASSPDQGEVTWQDTMNVNVTWNHSEVSEMSVTPVYTKPEEYQYTYIRSRDPLDLKL